MVPETRAVSWLLVLALCACAPKPTEPEGPAPGETVLVEGAMTRSEFHELSDVLGALTWRVLWRLPRDSSGARVALELVENDTREEVAKLDLNPAALAAGLLRITAGYVEVPKAPGSNNVRFFLGYKYPSGSSAVSGSIEDPFASMARSHGGERKGDHFVLIRAEERGRKSLILRLIASSGNDSARTGTPSRPQ